MTSDRPYRKAMSHDDAIKELQAYAGRQFDPSLVDIFISIYGDHAECSVDTGTNFVLHNTETAPQSIGF